MKLNNFLSKFVLLSSFALTLSSCSFDADMSSKSKLKNAITSNADYVLLLYNLQK